MEKLWQRVTSQQVNEETEITMQIAGGRQCEKLRTCFKNWRLIFCLFAVLVPFGLGYVFEFSMVHKLLFPSIEQLSFIHFLEYFSIPIFPLDTTQLYIIHIMFVDFDKGLSFEQVYSEYFYAMWLTTFWLYFWAVFTTNMMQCTR